MLFFMLRWFKLSAQAGDFCAKAAVFLLKEACFRFG